MLRSPHKVTLAVLAATALAVPVGAQASSGGSFHADLDPVPHDHTADGGSDVNGDVSFKLMGRRLTVDLTASGLTPNEPHAMHIHGVVGQENECPEADADTDGDGLVSLEEGAGDYGPILVSFTETGDTSPSSGLSLERFPVAAADGTLTYERTHRIGQDVARSLSSLHVVLHGTDLPSDGDMSSLSTLFEATLPVACGYVDPAVHPRGH